MDNPAFRSNEDVNQTRISRALSSWSSRLHLDRVRIRPVNIPNLNWRRRIPRPDWSALRKRLRLPRDCSLSKAQVKGLKMPPTRNRKGWCGCFQKDEPPEITYCVVDQNGMLRLQAMTPTQPMPDEEELNAKFAELVEELDLTPPNKAAMLNLPPEKKWQIYCNRKKDQDTDTSLSNLPEHYIEKVNAIATLNYPEEDPGEVETRTKMIDSLKTALRTQPNSFVLRFVELDGLSCLLNALLAMDVLTAHSSIHTALIGCLKALMNNSTGRAHVLAHPSSIKIIAQSLACDSPKTKSAVLEILGAVCLVPGGHRKVLEAMLHFQEFAGERTRFQTILNDLDRNIGVYKEDVGLKTAIMSFLNAVLNYGPGEDNLEFRLHLRYELLMLGIQPVIDKLRSHENETLDRHLDFFEMVRNEDEREMARRYEEVHIDSKSATSIFECLRKKLTHSAAYPHFMSLLQHCLLLPLDYGAHPYHWLLFDRIVQQIVLQTENGENYDISALEINVKELVHLLATEQELVAAQTKAEEFEKENGELLSRVAAKEQELDLRLQEKEDVEASLVRTKDKLEREILLHLEAKQKVSELEYQLSQLQSQLQSHISGTGMGNTANSSLAIVAQKSPPPPPPMAPLVPSGGPPPPPPPGLPPPPMMMPTAKTLIKKDVPPSSAPLKSFNWSKLPDHKVPGTIWAELEESKMYKVIDLEDFDKLFSAYQKNGLTNEGSVEDLRQMGRTQSTKQRVLSLVDSRRAQNCTILLSRLKMANEDITRAILGMDSRENLPIDMVEQLLKFIPSTEERALLEEHAEEVDNMARADKFLYDISRIPHYEQRLQSLYYKKRFTLSLNELKPKIKAILEASKEISRSKKLKRVLEIVLAVGNYMNRGQRGNAGGFRLSSLNKLADTKSSTTKSVTLLHYLVETLENKFKDVLMLEQDMPHIREAAKVSLAELEKEMGQLRQGLHAVEKEMEFHRTQAKPFSPHDRFVPAMKEFVSFASTQFSELEDNFHDMKIRYEKSVTLFGDDPSSMPPEEFFGVFDVFLTSLVEARQEIEAFKKRKEEEERRVQQEAELRKRTIERKHSKQHNGVLSRVTNGLSNGHANGTDKGEFDDLISALRTGDVFGEDLAKMRRNRRRASAASSSPTRNSASSLLSRESSRERVIRKNAP